MSVRVRFAPSPTGFLHIGGARTVLYNYLYAKATNGTLVLRIEDTDRERSSKEFETSQINDIKWLGMDYDEGPDRPGKFGPYRQSERLEIYKKYAEQLIDKGYAYYCFCSDDELTKKKEELLSKNLAPHYDGKCKKVDKETACKRIADGEKAVVRFKAFDKAYSFKDTVRGEVTFPEGMVGDFVIMRSNGLPVYNYCCVIDDWQMEITNVMRAEDHLPNTLRQLMVYEALGATPPVFSHMSLLVGEDRQKLSKRHGATSATWYRENGFLPQAVNNYLALLGWSHPDELDLFELDELKQHFTVDRFTKAPALFDVAKFKWINEQHLRKLPSDELVSEISKYVDEKNRFHSQSVEWKTTFCELFKEKIQVAPEINEHLEELFSSEVVKTEKLEEILSWESTPAIKTYLNGELSKLIEQGKEYATAEEFSSWLDHMKKEMKIKGKFLFMGTRGVLTGRDHGSDLKILIPLTPLKILKERVS